MTQAEKIESTKVSSTDSDSGHAAKEVIQGMQKDGNSAFWSAVKAGAESNVVSKWNFPDLKITDFNKTSDTPDVQAARTAEYISDSKSFGNDQTKRDYVEKIMSEAFESGGEKAVQELVVKINKDLEEKGSKSRVHYEDDANKDPNVKRLGGPDDKSITLTSEVTVKDSMTGTETQQTVVDDRMQFAPPPITKKFEPEFPLYHPKGL